MNEMKGMRMMKSPGKLLQSERGVALIIALVLAFVSLVVSTAVVYLVSQSTKSSGVERRYATALGAAKGGSEVAVALIDKIGNNPDSAFINIPAGGCQNRLRDKLLNKTADWDPAIMCPNQHDASFQFEYDPGGGMPLQQYDVTLTIVDTLDGNTEASEESLDQAKGVVNTGGAIANPSKYPRLYRVDVHSERPNPGDPANPYDVADLTMLYAR